MQLTNTTPEETFHREMSLLNFDAYLNMDVYTHHICSSRKMYNLNRKAFINDIVLSMNDTIII